MRDGHRVKHTFSFADHARYGSVGQTCLYTHPAEAVGNEKTAVPHGKTQVRNFLIIISLT